jgi:ribosome-binding factor A
MESRRAQRISESLREDLAALIGYELKDPRLVGVTVTGCHLSPDGRHLRVIVWLRGPEEERRAAMEALEHAQAFLRRQVAVRLRLFRAPELHFEPDDAEGGEGRVEQLLKRIRKAEKRAAEAAADAPADPPAKSPGDASS